MNEGLSVRTGPLAIQEGTLTIRHQRVFYRRMTYPRFTPDTKPHLVFLHEDDVEEIKKLILVAKAA